MIRTVPLAHDVDGVGPLLVAIHGMTEDRRSWARVPLAAHFRTVRVDLRGHGTSPRVPPYDPLSMAGDLHELVRALGIEQDPLVVGHSFGGVVATAYAARFPTRGVVTVDQTLDVEPLPARAARALRGEGFAEFMTSALARMYGQLDAAVAEEISKNRTLRQDVLLGAWAPLLDLEPPELAAFMANVMAMRQPTPFLSLHGLPVADDYPAWLGSRIPGAVVEMSPTVTHYPHLADPSWFVQRLTAFDSTLGR
ncbi:alpha/beta hydrolase [Verrucosispora sp. WMMD1129]|uniref:alpha/beta fold hydrolase n=1 Tax=Verrucosispora sp. WMMD1129 TaxID=3016093 RepID=UPI002499F119|nr:alpha/beta hydrolase [Verrucosispora sp. WMMD1129]WFE47979.1 alpha/beta hydrolase [Verrucosispora sp. WMMD1129]